MTRLAHDIVRSVFRPGEVAIDGTAGNGHDTLFLAQQAGPAGRIFAFDVQIAALESTRLRLTQYGCSNVTLIHGSHAEMEQQIPVRWHGEIGAAMFNLGYLPRHDHRLTTQKETTLHALQSSWKLLRPGGVLTVMAYRGHPGGEEEATAVEDWLDELGDSAAGPFYFPAARPTRGPRLLAVKKCEFEPGNAFTPSDC